MPRNNRSTVKSHRRHQRPKWARNPLTALTEAERATMRRVLDARPESGAARIGGALALVVALTAGALAASVSPAEAKAVQIQAPRPGDPVGTHNPLIYIERLDGPRRWFYAELSDGSQWMVTRCRQEDSDNCWWNARTRGNKRGKSFVVIDDVVHYYRPQAQP